MKQFDLESKKWCSGGRCCEFVGASVELRRGGINTFFLGDNIALVSFYGVPIRTYGTRLVTASVCMISFLSGCILEIFICAYVPLN